MLEKYASEYDVDMIVRDHGHYIAPDPITIEAVEGVISARKICSILELGAGLGTTGNIAKSKNIRDYLLIDRDPKLVKFMSRNHPGKVLEKDAFSYTIDGPRDLISVGIQYEFLPRLMEYKGKALAENSGVCIIQSGCTAHFEFEHEWLMGRVGKWPWYRETQTVSEYFKNVAELMFGFQTMIIAGNKPIDDVVKSLKARGFKEIKYTVEHS
jgi:hypothetical protein